MIVEIWTPDSEVGEEPKVLVVRQKDIQDFDVVASEFEKCTIFVANQDNPYFSIAFVTLALENGQDLEEIAAIPFLDRTDIAIIDAAIAVVESVGKNALDEASAYLGNIIKENKSSKFDKLINCLEALIDANILYRTDIVAASIYGSTTRKAWWLEQLYLFEVLSVAKKDIAKLSAPLSSKLLILLSPFDKLLFSPGQAEDAHKALSAFCYTLVPYFISRKHLITAYVLIHRALDLFYTSEAIRYGLILVKRDHLEYHNLSPGDDEDMPRIYLHRTYFDYVAIKDRLSVEFENTIRLTNKKRNELLYCHGVDSVSLKDVNNAYIETGKILKRSGSWKEYRSIFTNRIKVHITDVLVSAFNIRTVITEYRPL